MARPYSNDLRECVAALFGRGGTAALPSSRSISPVYAPLRCASKVAPSYHLSTICLVPTGMNNPVAPALPGPQDWRGGHEPDDAG